MLPDPLSRKFDPFSAFLLVYSPRFKVIIKNMAIFPKIQEEDNRHHCLT